MAVPGKEATEHQSERTRWCVSEERRALTHPGAVRSWSEWRRGRDSNPRCFRTPLFESGTINHSDTSPRQRIAKADPAADRTKVPSAGWCAGRGRRLPPSGDGGRTREELHGLVAPDSADDLDPSLEIGMLAQHPALPRRIKVVSGIRRDEAEALFAPLATG